jgi:hypothetical protein
MEKSSISVPSFLPTTAEKKIAEDRSTQDEDSDSDSDEEDEEAAKLRDIQKVRERLEQLQPIPVLPLIDEYEPTTQQLKEKQHGEERSQLHSASGKLICDYLICV